MGRFELVNEAVLAAQLLAIPENIRVAIEKKALTECNKLVVGRLRENAPAQTGALKKSFKYDIRRWKGGNVIAGLVGADNDFVVATYRENKRTKQSKFKFVKVPSNYSGGKRRRPSKYLHLLALGTKGWTSDTRHKAGAIKADDFREKTTEQLAPQIQQILENAVIEALNQ